jgi:2-polyprenyl-6-methoxyphenol hydroxylase-like FAD-dependent oxidoreductase
MSGHEYGRTNPEVNLGQTPAWKCILSQDAVETELLAHARTSEFGRILFGHEFVGYEEGEGGIAVTSRDLESGETSAWQADYLIAADGAGSSVRKQTGIEMRGPAMIAVMANEFWQADLSHLPGVAGTAGYRICPKDPSVPLNTVLNTNGRDRWLSLMPVGVERDERALPRTDDEVVRLARMNAGIPNLEVKVINRSVWRLTRQVAASFKKGRVFLVGDAAHRFPPYGGYGMNSGIQDAHNLAWKLAFVLNGRAGAGLLETYDPERRPIAESNADFSYNNGLRFTHADQAFRSGNVDRINFWIKDSDNHVHSIGQSLGFIYDEGALVPDGTNRPTLRSRYYEPSDRPGSRFPHFWLDLARRRSTLDWFDQHFVLVAGPKADVWKETARQVSETLRLRIDIHQLEETHASEGLLLGQRGAVLLRPDGHVAWRMPWVPSDPAAELSATFAKLLG